MKKIALSGLLIIIFIAYLVHENSEPKEAMSLVNPPSNSTIAPTHTAQSGVSYKDGEYTSSVGDAYFGPLQIKLIVEGGKVSDIDFLKYPNDRQTSIEINGQALPILRQEAIQAQNEKVDIVTGATQTAEAFQLLLKETLAKAKA